MARVKPFVSLRYAPGSGDPASRLGAPTDLGDPDLRARALTDPLHALQLADAPNPQAVLRRWRDAGHLVRARRPALFVLESHPVGGGLLASRRAPVHMLLGQLDGGDWEPLEEGASSFGGPGQAPALALAADDHAVMRELLAEAVRAAPPELEARVNDAVLRLWRVEDPAWDRRLQSALEEAPVRPLGHVRTDGPALAAVLPLSDPGLRLRPIHRGIQKLPNFNRETFLALVAKYARIYDLELPLRSTAGLAAAYERLGSISAGQHAVLLVLPGAEGKVLRFRQGLELEHIRAVPKNPTLRSLDLALLNALVLRTVLGIQDPQELGHPQVFPVPTLDTLIEQVDSGLFQVGFGLNPPPTWEIRAVMEAQQSLPPRTLTVEPAPPMGLVFIDE